MTDVANTSSRKMVPALIVVAITIGLLIATIWRVNTSPSTDDAYVYADTIDVVPQVSGRIVDMPVRDNQAVKRGDLLFRIDPRPYQDALDEARAKLDVLDKQIMLTQRTVDAEKFNAASVKAAVERARVQEVQAADTLRRMEPLLAQGFTSAEEIDRDRTAERSAKAVLNAALLQAQQAAAAVSGVDALIAQRAEIQAQIASAELNLEFTEVRAPFDGRVIALHTTVGQFASAMKPVFTLIDTQHWYVVANFRETELHGVRPGTAASVYLMSDTGKDFKGRVESIGYGVLPDDGGIVLQGLPRVERSINWVHVSQRFPVKILVDNPDPSIFRIGTSAVATLRRGSEHTHAPD